MHRRKRQHRRKRGPSAFRFPAKRKIRKDKRKFKQKNAMQKKWAKNHIDYQTARWGEKGGGETTPYQSSPVPGKEIETEKEGQ